MRTRSSWVALQLVLILALSLVAAGSAGAEDTVTYLWDGYVYDINDLGQAVGQRLSGDAVMWDGDEVITLWADGDARAINNRGQVVGRKFINDRWHAVLWDEGQLTTLWQAEQLEDVIPTDINNAGQVVGFRYSSLGLYGEALMWDKGELMTLGDGSHDKATAINDIGRVLGDTSEIGHVIWDRGESVALGFAGGYGPVAINNRGQVVGGDGLGIHYLWYKGEWTSLGFAPLDISDTGQMAGYTTQGAVIWDKGELITLWTGPGAQARAINNRGQVVGHRTPGGNWQAVLWEK
jgi:probable HAF family extracellular repeat protein